MWKLEGTVRSQNANNVQNYFACFQNYTQKEVLNISKLDLLLVSPLLGNIHYLEGANTKHNYKGRGVQFLVKIVTYHQPLGLNFWYYHQVYDNNNSFHYTISP